jgi:quinol monooxygenase YgiN
LNVLPKLGILAKTILIPLGRFVLTVWQTYPSRAAMPQTSQEERWLMVTVALLVRLEAKPGKEGEVDSFLRSGLAIVQEEPATTAWFAIRLGPSTFGIFDAFPNDAGRQAHLSGRVAAALMAKAPDLLARPPVIEKVDVLAAKLP